MQKTCGWPGDNELMIEYHDTEWGVPSFDDHHLFEMLLLEGAQAGLSIALLALVLVDDPSSQLGLLSAIGFLINAFAATQELLRLHMVRRRKTLTAAPYVTCSIYLSPLYSIDIEDKSANAATYPRKRIRPGRQRTRS